MSSTVAELETIDDPSSALRLGLLHGLKEQGAMMFFALIAFGVLAKENGFLMSEAVLSTAAMWALPAQLVHVEAVATDASLLMTAMLVFLTNLRFFPMVVSLMSGLKSQGIAHTLGLSHLVSAASWAWCMQTFDAIATPLRARYFIGFALMCWLAGVLGTVVGFFIGDYLNQSLRLLLLFVSPLYMLLILLNVRGHRLFAVLLGGVVGMLAFYWSPDWYLPIAAVVAGSVSFVLYKRAGR